MKKLVFIIGISLLLLNCSIDSGSTEPQRLLDYMPISEVYLPDEFNFGETYDIKMEYIVPNTCYSFRSLYVEDAGNIKTIVVLNNVLTNALCEPYNNYVAEAVLKDLKIDRRGTYIFKFWKGKDSFGEDNYYTVEVPVTE